MPRGIPGWKTLDLWIAIQPVFLVFLFSRSGPGLIRNRVAFDDTETSGNPADRTQREHGGREHHGVGQQARLRHHRSGLVRQKVPVRSVVSLPNSIEIGLTRDAARSSRTGSRGRRRSVHDDKRANNGGRRE